MIRFKKLFGFYADDIGEHHSVYVLSENLLISEDRRMSRREIVRHEFVEAIPDQLQEGVLYISIPYATALHRCLCGCGAEIVTPLSPTDWELSYDGETRLAQPLDRELELPLPVPLLDPRATESTGRGGCPQSRSPGSGLRTGAKSRRSVSRRARTAPKQISNTVETEPESGGRWSHWLRRRFGGR